MKKIISSLIILTALCWGNAALHCESAQGKGITSRLTGIWREAKKWAVLRITDTAGASPEWRSPQWVGDVNTNGWEDGPYISPDGRTLYFVYINVDLRKLPNVVVIGPNRDPFNICKPPAGQFPRADLFYSTKDNSGKWKNPVPHPLTVAYPVGGLVLAGDNKAYFMMEKEDGLKTEIYSSVRVNGVWQKPKKIESLSSPYKDDDPYVTPTDDALFFWSDRPAVLAGNNIYFAQKLNGVWQAPIMLPEPINSNANDMQPFVWGDTLYFSSDRSGVMKIYRSRLINNVWSVPEVVIASKYGVGEPTLTDDGKYLYFVQIFVADDGSINPEVMYVERK